MNSAGQGLPGDPYGYKPDSYQIGYPTVAKKTTDKLKPCPFCNSKDAGVKQEGRFFYLYHGDGPKDSQCILDYMVFGPFSSVEKAVDCWNRRANE